MKHKILTLLLALLLLSGCARECQSHTDADQDHICDQCSQSTLVEIDIFSVNDLHGRLMDTDDQPGVDELNTYLTQAREDNENVILLSAGDMWQGSAESNLTKGQLMTQWMNETGFAAMTMGNHEFDWGEEPILANAELAEFPFLAINIYQRETNTRVSYCQSSVVIDCDGVQVGIIGAIGDCYSSISSEQVKDIYFITGNELTQLVHQEAQDLRSQGVDFIIYLLHDGLGDSTGDTVSHVSDQKIASYYTASLSEADVDLVFEAHTHCSYLLQDQYGVYHLQNGGDNNGGISHVALKIDSVTGQGQVETAQLVDTETYDMLEDDPLLDTLLDQYQEELAVAFDSIGTLRASVPGNVLRQTVADLYYMEALVRWSSDYDIVLGGGFISIRQPGYLSSGEVTYSQLMELFPFDNELVLCSVSGRDLKANFFETDNTNYFISYGDYGAAVQADLDPNATYYIVVDSYTSTYAPNRLTEIERYGQPVYARDLLATYISMGGLN